MFNIIKPTFVETHAHLYDATFDEDRDVMLENAFQKGVEQLWMPNCNSETIEPMLAIAKKYPDSCLPMIGLHPCYVKDDFESEIALIEQYLENEKFIAIGEIGLDLYWDKTYFDHQKKAFLKQCELAKKYHLWIDIHCREAFWETIALLEINADSHLKGIFHCFSGGIEEANKVIEMGFLLGIGGVLTFKNAGLDKIIEKIDLQHIVLETDAPYLAPVPYRGKRNESAYLFPIAQKLADLHQISIEEVAKITSQNARNLLMK